MSSPCGFYLILCSVITVLSTNSVRKICYWCVVILYTQGVLVPIPAPILNSFPVKLQVGLVKKSLWNLQAQKIHPTFLWQKPTYPFGYPYASDPDQNGDVTITYPPRLTHFLRLPLSKKKCKRENIPITRESLQTKKMMRELCATINLQSW